MSPPVPVLSVEERLRLVLAYLDVMGRIACLVDKPVPDGFSHFVDLPDFAQWVSRIAGITAAQASSALAALPAATAKLDAPLAGGAR